MAEDVKETVEQVIRELAEERNLQLPTLTGETEIVDELGFNSLMVAALIANLEEVFGVDPFAAEDVMITDIRTIKDLAEVYAVCLEQSN